MTNHQLILLTLITVSLAACGGGNNDPAITTAFNVAQGVTNFYNSAGTYQLSSTDGSGNSYALQYVLSAPVATASPSSGYSYTTGDHKITIEASLSTNGGSPITQNYIRYYRASPFSYSYFSEGSSSYALYTAASSFPSATTPFSGLTVENGQGFATTPSCQAAGTYNCFAGNITTNLSLVAESKDVGMVCLISVDSIDASYEASAKEECIRIDPAGNVMGITVQFPVNGQLLTFQ